jgi:hypothetical protein
MAQAPVKHNHDEPAHKPALPHTDPLMAPLAEPGGPALVGAIGVRGDHIEDGSRDPGTIAEEQRRRSDEYVKAMATHAPPPEPHAASHLPSPKK